MLALSMAAPCFGGALPPHYLDLIRHEKFAEIELAVAAQIAEAEADAQHRPQRLCAALDQSVRANLFDLYQPLAVKLAASERALQCRQKLPDSAANTEHAVMLKAALATLVFSSGDRKRASDLYAQTAPRIRQYRTRADKVDYVIATISLSSFVTLAHSDFEGALAWIDEGLATTDGNDVESRMLRVKLLTIRCYRLGRLGRFAEAEAAGNAAASLAAEVFGVPSIYHPYALETLGEVQYFAHHLAAATITMELAIDDDHRLGAHTGDNLAVNLMVFANIQTDIGDYARGRAALTEAIAIERRPEAEGSEGNLAAMLNNLGMLEAASGHCEAALPPEREGLQIDRQHYGEDSEELTAPLSVIGNCELETGQLDKARTDYGQALAIDLKKLGENNPQIAERYQEMAQVDLANHDYVAATARLTHALSRLPQDQDTLGKQRIAIERNLARSLHAQRQDDDAFEHAVAAETERQRQLQRFSAALDEGESLLLRENEPGGLDEVLALAAAHRNPTWIERAWQLEIGSRSLVTRLVAARLKAARSSTDPQMQALWTQWNKANSAWSDALDAAESGKGNTDSLTAARYSLERAEQALAAKAGGLGDSSEASVAALRAALPPDSALVGFVATRNDPWSNDYLSVSHPANYYAFRLAASSPPALIDLGDANALNAAVRDWTAALRDPARSAADVEAFGKDVSNRVWQPLGLADGLHHLYLVPEGELHRLAWLALPLHDGLLVERGPVPVLLDSEHALLNAASVTTPSQRLLLVGDVTPDVTLTSCGSALHALPGARRELDALRVLWKQSGNAGEALLVGNEATKAAVRTAMAQNTTIHFATHAFSEDSDCMHTLFAARGVRLSKAGAPQAAQALSGLLLAADRHAVGADRDGLFTAPEIAAMHLDGVDTVTLAACDTGSGTVHPDEGVFGLARAFRLAGARTVVMSLWNVDDDATADLMQRMYRARWFNREAAADALADAARSALATRRAAGQSTHPYYWAAFVAAGSP